MESDWLGNDENYYFTGSSIPNNGFNRTPTIYTPKIGTNQGPASPGMIEGVVQWPILGTNAFYHQWDMGMVGYTSHNFQPISQETYLNSDNSAMGSDFPCHMIQLKPPGLYSANYIYFNNNWYPSFISEAAGIQVPYTTSYTIDECVNIVAFFECTLKRGGSSTSKIEGVENISLISTFPNPSNGKFSLYIPKEKLGKGDIQFKVFDITGKCIINQYVEESIIKYSPSEIDGIYFIQVIQGGKVIYGQKIVSVIN